MKTIGMLGGMSWESTLGYYRLINEGVKERLGALHSAKVALVSVDFEPIEKMQHAGDWDGTAKELCAAANSVEAAGADFLLICTNTMHKIAPQIEEALGIPLLHIADATAEVLCKKGIERVGLLGTAFTMEQEFYKGRLEEKYGLEVLVPPKEDRELVHQIIYEELCLGKTKEASKKEYLRIISDFSKSGAEGVILGCTEIGMLVKQDDTNVKLFDTTLIHATRAVEEAVV